MLDSMKIIHEAIDFCCLMEAEVYGLMNNKIDSCIEFSCHSISLSTIANYANINVT